MNLYCIKCSNFTNSNNVKEKVIILYILIKHLVLLEVEYMMYIKNGFLQWCTNISNKSLLVVLLKVKLC